MLSVKHLLAINSLTPADLVLCLERAKQYLASHVMSAHVSSDLAGAVVANLFFEPSTRTRHSFEIAARRLGAIVVHPDFRTSSLVKGESLIDTVRSLEAMGARLFVVRHAEDGVPAWIAEQLSSESHVVNAGDGKNQHPTQALLDLLTISMHKPDFKTLSVAIVGDVRHSRVAHSLTEALTMMGVPSIRYIAPPDLLPLEPPGGVVRCFTSLQKGLWEADVVVALRLQKERMQSGIDEHLFHDNFGVTQKALRAAKPDAIVMHPGPMNRMIEIDSAVADGAQSVILEQVRNGVAVRMAVMSLLLGLNT